MLRADSHQIATFEDWIDGRRPQHLSTNAGAPSVAFQDWRRFKEAFAPELIRLACDETAASLGRNVRNCIDPFSGSGTTGIACQFLGVSPFLVEVNPYLADLTEAKLYRYDVAHLIRDFKKVVEAPRRRMPNQPFPGSPPTFVEPGIEERFVFYRPIAQRLAHFRNQIAAVRSVAHRRLMRVLLGATALEVSNVVVSGKGRRYRRDWQDRDIVPSAVDTIFEEKFAAAVYEIKRYRDRACTSYELLRGDSRELIPVRRKFDLAVFSPPYPNSFDYTDVYNVELWVCGYLQSREDNHQLRSATLRSHVQLFRDFSCEDIASQTLVAVRSELEEVRESLWNKHIPDMVAAYFDDITTVLSRLYRCVRPGGRIYIVAGDSRYKDVCIPVTKITGEIAATVGLVLVDEKPFRSMRTSPQQGGKQDLSESLLVLGRER